MKSPARFIYKLRLFHKMFIHDKPMTVTSCYYCESPYVRFENGEAQEGGRYTSNYVCTKCGAKAVNTEVWEKGE